MVVWTALTPALSPEEREEPSPVFGIIGRLINRFSPRYETPADGER